jgi:hypothetical protein
MRVIRAAAPCALFVLASLWVGASSPAQADELKDAFYDTPEGAIRHFVEGIAKNDVARSLQVSAANEIGTKYDFKGMAQRLQIVMLTATPAPTEYGAYRQLNKYVALGEMAAQIKLVCLSLLAPDTDVTAPVQIPSAEAAGRLVESINPLGLAKLKVARIDPPNVALASKEARALAVKQAAPYGATDATERLVLLDLNGQLYYLGVRLLQYGRYWKIMSLSSYFANTRMAAAVKTTIKEYEAILAR